MNKPLVSVVIPTWNNPQYVVPCVNSLLAHTVAQPIMEVIVVNNGEKGSVKDLGNPRVRVLDIGENKGWCGGLNAGVSQSDAEYIVLCNDDIFVPAFSRLWLNKMVQHFMFPECGAVGPSSNFVMGLQAIWDSTPSEFRPNFLIGFFMMMRRKDFIDLGGMDESFPMADDMDLSLRIRKSGKYLLADKDIFIYHHGAKTGPRVEGNYWYSAEQQMDGWNRLFRKHGVKTVYDMLMVPFSFEKAKEEFYGLDPLQDHEGKVVRGFLQEGKTLEIGCGGTKTVPWSVGLDRISKDEMIPGMIHPQNSVADVVHDAGEPLPFEKGEFQFVIARHILEHMLDPLQALKDWKRVLAHGGKLIIAVPNQIFFNTIPMNPEHIHAFTPDTLKHLAQAVGLKHIETKDPGNHVSFVSCFERNGDE